MLADLHCHYPMHLLARVPDDPTLQRMVRARRRPRWVDRLRARVLGVAARLLNYRRWSGGWRVDLDGLERGDTRVVLSVLYLPFAEMDLDEPFGAPPEPGYFADLIEQLDGVERELGAIDPEGRRHLIVRRAADLGAARDDGRVAFLHAVEGGFHLGGTPEEVDRNVGELAARGVAYVTLAHLFWRQIATNAPALPFLPDRLYDRLFPQPSRGGLTELGIAAVRAMYRERVLVDISHMREDALADTFALLTTLDREHGRDPRDFPVISSHAGFRLGEQHYMHTAQTVRAVADRGGVVGLIFAQHQLNDGVRRTATTTLEESLPVLYRHIDAIHSVTGTYDHVGIGTDFDGFIKPTLGGLESAADMALLQEPMAGRYGAADAERILSGNAVRVLERVFEARRSG
jgi:microsomal dipeptidase-like Zn-dependent dipeptidase